MNNIQIEVEKEEDYKMVDPDDDVLSLSDESVCESI
jgi:hypothetical protein